MTTMTLAQATAEYNEFVNVSEEPEEMDFDSWIAWERIDFQARVA